MGQFMGINALHINYLDPLLKWKIMDIKSLLRYSKTSIHFASFSKIINKLQKLGLIKSITDPSSRMKYVYFTEEGLKLTSGSDKLLISNETSPEHDARASEIARMLLESGYIEKVVLEHEFYSKNSIIPDASLIGQKNGRNYSIAFEFELTRKSKTRVIGKIKSYFSSTDFDYIMYFFESQSLMYSYEKFIKEELGGKYLERIIFVYHPAPVWRKIPLSQAVVVFKGEEKILGDIFE